MLWVHTCTGLKHHEVNTITTLDPCAGIQDEFIFVGRLDNLAMSFCSLAALIDTCSDADALAGEAAVRGIALFDNEEVGSASAAGENSYGTGCVH